MKNIEKIFGLRWLRKGLVLGLVLVMGIVNFGCEEEDSGEYYVKYEMGSSTRYMGGNIEVEVNTEDNTKAIFTTYYKNQEEVVIGPVEKGFTATMKVTSSSNAHNTLKLYANIYVSKDGSPFALKKSDGSDEVRDNLQINYKIDY